MLEGSENLKITHKNEINKKNETLKIFKKFIKRLKINNV